MAVKSQTEPTGQVARPEGTVPTPGRWAGRLLWLNLVVEIGIVVTGGLVRLTGSGLGCPTWPQCVPGSYTPVVHQAEGYHKYIEFGNRTLTGVVGIAALAVLVVVWRRTRLRRLALLLVVGVGVQAVLGGITVLTGLHPTTVALHFMVSMALIALSVLLLLGAREGDGAPQLLVPVTVQRLAWLLAGVGAVVLLLGTVVTGSGPHSGDADEPARFALDPRTISWLHADMVLLFVGLLVGVLVALALVRAPAAARRWGWWLLAVTLAQGVVGYVQYGTGLPVPLVMLHMLGASLLTVALTGLLVSLRHRP